MEPFKRGVRQVEAAWYLCLSSLQPFLVTWPLGIAEVSPEGEGVDPATICPFSRGCGDLQEERGPLPSPCLQKWGSQELRGQ